MRYFTLTRHDEPYSDQDIICDNCGEDLNHFYVITENGEECGDFPCCCVSCCDEWISNNMIDDEEEYDYATVTYTPGPRTSPIDERMSYGTQEEMTED
jgi:hypothetical protein